MIVIFIMLPDVEDLLKPRPRKYRNIIKHLSALTFSTGSDTSLSEEDIFHDLSSSRGTDYLLGLYSQSGIELVYEKFGVFRELKKRGLPNPKIELNTIDPFQHTFRVTHRIKNQILVSVEVVMRKGSFPYPEYGNTLEKSTTKKPLDLLIVEWFLLQNPSKRFSKRRPQLPGQDLPGLGLSELAFELLYWTARRLRLDGVILVPNFLHTGLFYGRQFLFIDPVKEGIIHNLEKKCRSDCSLDQLTWACAEGQLIDRKNESVFNWIPAPMALPITKRFKDYFHRPDYKRIVNRVKATAEFSLNEGYEKQYNSHWKSE